MPTLHLIDADSTQACPAVFGAIRADMAADDRLLLLGGHALREAAEDAGIAAIHQIAVPFGKAILGLPALWWWKPHIKKYDLIRCWSIGALRAASVVAKHAPLQLELAHTPSPAKIKYLARISKPGIHEKLQIFTDGPTRTHQLTSAGVACRSLPLSLGHDEALPMSVTQRRSLRASWGVHNDRERVVALLSDDARMVDAVDAAAVAVMGCSTLLGRDEAPLTIHLLIHPMQCNRRRAEELLAHQPVAIRLVQDAGLARPWAVLGGCNAALTLGPDAGGLSLRWAVKQGIPVVASATGPACELNDDTPGLRLARSAMHKDLAHELNRVLGG